MIIPFTVAIEPSSPAFEHNRQKGNTAPSRHVGSADDANTEVSVLPYMFLSAFAMVCSVPVLITAMVLISRHISQRRLAVGAAETVDIIRRLERIEQSVEISAVEIERIAESNRFMSRLLAEKAETLSG